MNVVQVIAKNIGVLLASKIIGYTLSFFFMMYTARYLGAKGYGILSFALAFTGIFAVFSDFGLNQLTVREISRDKNNLKKYLENITLMKFILIGVTLILITFTVNFLDYPEETVHVVYLISFSVAISAFTQTLHSIFQAYETMEYISISEILNSVLLLAGAIFAISEGFSVIWFAALYLISSSAVFLYSFFVLLLKFVVPTKIEFDQNFWKFCIKEALPFGLAGVFTTIYYYIDTVMISFMIPDADEVIGWYNAAYKLILVLLFIPSVYFSSVFPLMCKLFNKSEHSLEFVFERSLKYMTIMAVPIGVGTTLLADKIILFILGSDFEPAAIALKILIWSTVFIFMSLPFGTFLNSINKQIVTTKIAAGGAVLNTVLNLFIIPKYSYIGASATTVITELAILLTVVYIFRSSESQLYPLSRNKIEMLCKVIISCLMMLFFIIFFYTVSLLLLIIASSLIYFISFYLIGGVDNEDLKIIRNLIHSEGNN
jgi:O-antigen/teichoic acid export membrane protein